MAAQGEHPVPVPSPGNAPSWHPAFRPDHESSGNDGGHFLEEAHDDEELPTSSAVESDRSEPPSWTSHSHLQAEIPQSDDDFFDRYGQNHEQSHEPIPHSRDTQTPSHTDSVGFNLEEPGEASGSKDVEDPAHNAGDEVTPVSSMHEGTRDTLSVIDDGQSQQERSDDRSPSQLPEQLYEHQGEPTDMESAVQESEEAPLIAAEEEPSAEDWGASEDWQIGQQELPLQVQSNGRSADAFNLGTVDEHGLDLAIQEPQWPDVSAAVFSVDESQLASTDTHLASDISNTHHSEGVTESTQGVGTSEAVPEAAKESSADEWGASESTAFDFAAPASLELGVAPTSDIDAWANAFEDDDFLPESDAAAAFGFDDGEGFLEDEAPGPASVHNSADTTVPQRPHARSISSVKYTPSNAPQPQAAPARSESYRPGGLNLIDLSKPQAPAAPVPRGLASSPYQSAYQQPVQRPAISSAESFADKAKGGYHSPYDLPDDLTIKKRKPLRQTQPQSPNLQDVAPPPRSSSMRTVSAMGGPVQQQNSSAALNRPTVSPHLSQGALDTPSEAQTSSRQAPSRDSGFFADLPVTQRPSRQGTPSGRHSVQPGLYAAPAPMAPPAPVRSASLNYTPQALSQQALPSPGLSNLRPAEIMPLYSEEPQIQPRSVPMPPAPSTRYSPAVPPTSAVIGSGYAPALPTALSNSSRYSPAPSSKPLPGPAIRDGPTGPPKHAQSYTPRTSSPLAYHGTTSPEQHMNHLRHQVSNQQDSHGSRSRTSLDRISSVTPISGLETVNENADPTFSLPTRPDAPRQPPPQISRSSTTPPPRSNPSSNVGSPRKRANYAPTNYQSIDPIASQGFVPPRRSQTSSPGAALRMQHLTLASLDRPASVAAVQSPTQSVAPQTNRVKPSLAGPAYHEMANLIVPQDSTSQDPLQRWKGAPIFHWGNGNSIITTFPKYTPEYGSGQMAIRPFPGMVRSQNLTELCPQSDIFLKFPGPLKKGKKKEVLAWLKSSAEILEAEHKTSSMNGEFTTALHKRSEERIMLWKVMGLLIEHDGVLEGTPVVEAAVRALITPVLPDEANSADGIDSSSAPQPEAFDPQAVKALRKQLYAGEREKAVWHAVDQRLWAHALLIASTLNNKNIWKQVVQEFVRKEVRRSGDNTEALAALYQVFAGNWEESIDELVPVSARSGFQMVSTSNAGPTQKDALAGLDQWRETLLLVLNNRSTGDAAALASLGNLLNGYGRIEAGHICFLFARNAAKFGGADDEQSHYTLVGGSKAQQGLDLGKSLDTVLLSEVFEFAMTLGSMPVPPVPHLQAYKLYHAEVLAEAGKRTEAQQYCDAITGIATAKANRSPYYNANLMKWLDDFARRLSQAPADKSDSSWKPSIDKVSSSIWGKFNTFIAGESDNITAPPPSNVGADPASFTSLTRAVPVSTMTTPPPLSRAATDIYPHYHTNGGVVTPAAAASTNSRYAPSGAYTPRTSSEQQRPKYEAQSQSFYHSRVSGESSRSAYEPRTSFDHGPAASPQTTAPNSPHSNSSQSAGFGQQSTNTPATFSVNGSQYRPSSSSYVPSPLYNATSESDPTAYLPTPPADPPTYPMDDRSFAPTAAAVSDSYPQAASFEDPSQTSSYEPLASTFSYEPPASNYEPPSYQPYEPDAPVNESEANDKAAKKKSFMDDDDDDDFAARNAAIKKQQKAEADRIAEEKFKEAAEADASKSKDDPTGSRQSWFGGWFGAKKDPNAPTIYKAKLGDESSFYFDKDLNKWVNKKSGTDASTPSAATPPPPRSMAPPSRPPSGLVSTPTIESGPPPPDSRSGTPASQLGGMAPPPLRSFSSSSIPPAGPVAALQGPGGPPSRPPSRPGTSMSNASDIDDLLGPALPRRGATKKAGARKGRYVDVMAQKN